MLWTVDEGFSITEVNDDSVLDDSPDFVVGSVDEALQSLMFLLGTVELRDMDGVDGPVRRAA